MIQKLRRHLTFLFTAATGVILTLVLVVAFFYQSRLKTSQSSILFQSHLLDLTHRLEGAVSFSDDWLAKTESDSRLIIHIEDNCMPLFFPGSFHPATDRDTLILRAKKEALQQGIDTSIKPFSSSLLKSSVFKIKGTHKDTYQGVVLVIGTESHFRSLVLLSDTTHMHRAFWLQAAFFLLLWLFGILSLFLVSRLVVRQAVAPIGVYHQKQTDFIAAASHELRSPLALIKTSASAILSVPESAPKMARRIEMECTRAGSLIQQLLLLSSGNALLPPLEKVEADLLLLQLFESYEPVCTAKGIRLSLKLPDAFLPEVLGCPEWIYQIFCILLDNAIAYGCTTEKPLITITAATKEQGVSVCFTDHGKGIPDSLKEHIFDRFYRADPSRTDKEHTGLGLSIAKAFADRMPLSLHVTDTPGGGTTFEVLFLI